MTTTRRNPAGDFGEVESERDAWAQVHAYAMGIIASAGKNTADVKRQAEEIMMIARRMDKQVRRGVHANPGHADRPGIRSDFGQPDLSLDVSAPNKVAPVLNRAAEVYRDSASELEAAWHERSAGRPWERIATILERAANSIGPAIGPLWKNGGQRHATNPPGILALVNPPVTVMATCVYEIAYKHKHDGRDYVHKFEEWDRVKIGRLGPHEVSRVLLYGDGIPIIDMFPSPGE